jgi:hypothetical protein
MGRSVLDSLWRSHTGSFTDFVFFNVGRGIDLYGDETRKRARSRDMMVTLSFFFLVSFFSPTSTQCFAAFPQTRLTEAFAKARFDQESPRATETMNGDSLGELPHGDTSGKFKSTLASSWTSSGIRGSLGGRAGACSMTMHSPRTGERTVTRAARRTRCITTSEGAAPAASPPRRDCQSENAAALDPSPPRQRLTSAKQSLILPP